MDWRSVCGVLMLFLMKPNQNKRYSDQNKVMMKHENEMKTMLLNSF